MKLVIQIPSLNEEAQLAQTLRDLPQSIPGIDQIEVLTIDDGSTDQTAEVARSCGSLVVSLPTTRGLANAFLVGIEASLSSGADIIVNTDADNQYQGNCIPMLLMPILAGKADLVVGTRPIDQIKSFSRTKKLLQRVGSWVVSKASGCEVVDATSGFRAMSRSAALRVNVFSRYTYTLETIVQAGRSGLRVVSVPIAVNHVSRESRLVRNSMHYVWRTSSELLRILIVYRPFRSFMLPAIFLFSAATIVTLRFAVYFLAGAGAGGGGHVQSLILATILFGLSGVLMAVAFLGDLFAINRRLLEDLQVEARKARYGKSRGAVDG